MIQSNIVEQKQNSEPVENSLINLQTDSRTNRSISIRKIAKLDDCTLHLYAKKYGSFSRKGQREFAAFLPEINRRQLFLKHKYHTISHYAAVYGSLNKKTVEAVLYVAKKLEDKAVLLELLPTQGWSKLRVVCTVATVQDQEFWKEKVESMSKSALETFVSELKKQGDLIDGKLLGGANVRGVWGAEAGVDATEAHRGTNEPEGAGVGTVDSLAHAFGNPKNMASNKQNMSIEEFLPGEKLAITQIALTEAEKGHNYADFSAEHNSGAVQQRNNISFKVTVEVEKQLRLFKHNLEKSKKQAIDWNQVMEEFLRITKEKEALESEIKTLKREQKRGAKKVAKNAAPAPTIEDIKNSLPQKSTRPIPAKVDHFLQQKYKGMCGYPDCKKPAEIRQHTRRFKLFPNHDPDFIVPLCKKHDQLAHLGLIKNEEKQPIDRKTGAKNWKIQIYANKNAPKYKVDQIVNKFRHATG